MAIRIKEFVRDNGDIPYRAWVDRLEAQAATKVAAATFRLSLGNTGTLKSLGGGLTELRIDWGPGLRIYLAQDGGALVVLFGGGTKHTQARDIEIARVLLAEYRASKKSDALRGGKARRRN